MARDLEEAAVLAAKPDRDDGGLRALDELRGEGLPARINRGLEAERVGRGRNRAGRKDDHRPAPREVGARDGPGGEIGPLGFFGSREITGRMKLAASGARVRTIWVSTRKSLLTLLTSQAITMPSSTPYG